MIIDLSGKTALVCGSTQGIGNAIATQLAASGATVCLLARNEATLHVALNALPVPIQQKHFIAVADFSKPESLTNALANITANHSIDILINNTGGPASGPIVEAKPEQFLMAFQQHLICNQILVEAVIAFL